MRSRRNLLFNNRFSGLDVLLVKPDSPQEFVITRGNETPIDLLTLTTFLLTKGVKAGFLDMNIYKDADKRLFRVISGLRPRIIGFSCYSANARKAGLLAEELKKRWPSIITIMGGVHASAVPEIVLAELSAIDYVLVGDGEEAFHDFVSYALRGDDVMSLPSLVFRFQGNVIKNSLRQPLENLDNLPVLKYELADLSRYIPFYGNFYTLPAVALNASRGCLFRCTFCASSAASGAGFRQMSPPRIIAEIEYCISRLNVKSFKFSDAVFLGGSPEKISEFCNLITQRYLKIRWSCFSHVSLVARRPDLLKKMREAGCFQIKYGAEAGDEQVLLTIQKKIVLGDIETAIDATKKAGIETKVSFIFGFSKSVDEETLNLALRLSPHIAVFNKLTIFPGSADFSRFLQQQPSFHLTKDNWHNVRICSREENLRIAQLLQRSYLSFYLAPARMMQLIKLLLSQLSRLPFLAVGLYQFFYILCVCFFEKYSPESVALPERGELQHS